MARPAPAAVAAKPRSERSSVCPLHPRALEQRGTAEAAGRVPVQGAVPFIPRGPERSSCRRETRWMRHAAAAVRETGHGCTSVPQEHLEEKYQKQKPASPVGFSKIKRKEIGVHAESDMP
ncbi:unnamed protein product [Coccothraustes coccothraustes]